MKNSYILPGDMHKNVYSNKHPSKEKQLKSLGCVHTKIYYSEVKTNTTIKKTKLDKFCLHNTEGNMQSTVPYFYKY